MECRANTRGGYRCSHPAVLNGYCVTHYWLTINKPHKKNKRQNKSAETSREVIVNDNAVIYKHFDNYDEIAD